MLAELIPECPRLHHGVMVLDNPKQCTGDEWVCRLCGTRLYSTDQGPALPQVVEDNGADPRAGMVYNTISRNGNTGGSKERDRNHSGKWYE
jgi:hypothetical protein